MASEECRSVILSLAKAWPWMARTSRRLGERLEMGARGTRFKTFEEAFGHGWSKADRQNNGTLFCHSV